MENIILLITTSLISGLIATLVTILWQKRSEAKRSKQAIFETLMSYRYDIADEKNVAALNKIDIVFYKNKNVIEAYKEFKLEADNAATNSEKIKSLLDKHMKILEEIAKCLHYNNINWEVIKDRCYFPQALSSKIQEEAMLRKMQLNNVAHTNNSNSNTQVPSSEQIGLQIAMKMLESPDGIQKMIELADKFGTKPPKNK